MSTIKSNNHQIGQSATATNNATWYQPATPDGTVRLGVGNAGATTADVITASSTGVTIPSVSSSNTFGFKNRIINPGMVIDQRNAGASGTATGYTVDRWSYNASQSSKGTWQQNAGAVNPPAGFSNYLGFTSASAYSVVAGDYFAFQQVIEGFNVADLAWGTASAKTITLSFWVRSSLSGTFGGAIQNSGLGQSYPFSYSISSTNTWEQKSIVISGSTSSTWLSTNGAGLYLALSLGAGSTWSGVAGAWSTTPAFSATGATSVVGTNGATFYITGVQLEVGSQATSFDFRSYGQELALCQRYFQALGGIGSNDSLGTGFSGGTTFYIEGWLTCPMRTAPTISYIGTLSNLNVTGVGVSAAISGLSNVGSGNTAYYLSLTSASSITAGQGCNFRSTSAGTYLTASAEL